MDTPPKDEAQGLKILATINQLMLKAFGAEQKEALYFVIVNDTLQLVSFERAFLFDVEETPKLLAISGYTHVNEWSGQVLEFEEAAVKFKSFETPALVDSESLPKSFQNLPGSFFLWPLKGRFAHHALLLEKKDKTAVRPLETELITPLMRAYTLSLDKFASHPKKKLQEFLTKKRVKWGALALLLLALFPVPLRVAAPCEVVAKDPILITAPLEGIIESVVVLPGNEVKSGDLLFKYDARIPLETLKVAAKQVEVAESKLNRTRTLGINDPKSLAEVAVLELELEREKLNLERVQKESERLVVQSPSDGVIVMESPEEWRGNPVKVGEKIMYISDPKKTEIKIWIPETDNIVVSKDLPVKVFLHVFPTTSFKAELRYISSFTTLSPQGIPSFTAEASWDSPADVALGLKGTAILNGPRVPLIFWLLRKPIAHLREITGF